MKRDYTTAVTAIFGIRADAKTVGIPLEITGETDGRPKSPKPPRPSPHSFPSLASLEDFLTGVTHLCLPTGHYIRHIVNEARKKMHCHACANVKNPPSNPISNRWQFFPFLNGVSSPGSAWRASALPSASPLGRRLRLVHLVPSANKCFSSVVRSSPVEIKR